jgi:hypothetical protein
LYPKFDASLPQDYLSWLRLCDYQFTERHQNSENPEYNEQGEPYIVELHSDSRFKDEKRILTNWHNKALTVIQGFMTDLGYPFELIFKDDSEKNGSMDDFLSNILITKANINTLQHDLRYALTLALDLACRATRINVAKGFNIDGIVFMDTCFYTPNPLIAEIQQRFPNIAFWVDGKPEVSASPLGSTTNKLRLN